MSLWDRMKAPQLELLDAALPPESAPSSPSDASNGLELPTIESLSADLRPSGEPVLVPLAALFEDSANPRTEFPKAELDELTEDIRQHGILQPIVVHPADATGRFRIQFGAKRFRAAARAGLLQVPVTVRQAAADPYAQVAENQKRHGLSPLDLARFIRSRVDLGETNAAIAGRLGVDLTTVAHHLALLELPAPLDAALKSGRCVSPRTLYELRKVHAKQPDAVAVLLQGDKPITREATAALLRPVRRGHGSARAAALPPKVPKKACTPGALAARAELLCTQLATACSQLRGAGFKGVSAERLATLRDRVSAVKVLLDP
jgi:ParB family transcriptional regulator, chromosome partitioning protein